MTDLFRTILGFAWKLFCAWVIGLIIFVCLVYALAHGLISALS